MFLLKDCNICFECFFGRSRRFYSLDGILYLICNAGSAGGVPFRGILLLEVYSEYCLFITNLDGVLLKICNAVLWEVSFP